MAMKASASCCSSSNLVRPVLLLCYLACLADNAQAQPLPLHSQLPPLPNVDPLSDGIYLRSVELPVEGLGATHSSHRQRLITYDFRPAFPPYTTQSMGDLLLSFPTRKDEPPPAPMEEEETTTARASEEKAVEEARERVGEDGHRGALSPHVDADPASTEEVVLGNEATTSGAAAAVLEREAGAAVDGTNERTPSSETVHAAEIEAKAEDHDEGEAEPLAEDNPTPAAEDGNQDSDIEEATAETRSEDDRAPATEDEVHPSEMMLPIVDELLLSESGGSSLEMPSEEVPEDAPKQEATEEEDEAVIDEVQESQDSNTDMLPPLEEESSPLPSSVSITEGEDATTAESAATAQKEQPSLQDHTTLQAGKEAATEEHEPVVDVDAPLSFPQVEAKPSQEAAAPSVGADGEHHSISDVAADNAGDAVADGGALDATEQKPEEEKTDFDLEHAADDADEQQEREVVTPVVRVEDSSHQADETLRTTSQHKEQDVVTPAFGAEGDISHQADETLLANSQNEEQDEVKPSFGMEGDISHQGDETLPIKPQHREQDVVKPAFGVKGDTSRQVDETLLKKSLQEDVPSLSSDGEIKIPHRDADQGAPPSTSSKDANREFVLGLDELDKLFESVEVPDELDVGADGSSLQDVLVGQGLKIMWKRAQNFSAGVKRRFETVLGGVTGLLGGDDEAEEEEGSLSAFASLVDMDMLRDAGGSGGEDLLPSAHDARREEHDDAAVPPRTEKQTAKEQRKKKIQQQKEEKKRLKKKKGFPVMKPKKARTLWKFARRKWEEALHMLEDLLHILDDEKEDESDAELRKLQAGLGMDMPNLERKFGSEVDESFLKSKYAMMERNEPPPKETKS